MLLPITLTFAAACALLNLWIATRCARIRISGKILHGDAGNTLLARRMRAHANFVEYTPIVLILFLMAGLLERALGRVGINVVTRLLGMLLAALAVQFVLDGLRGFGLAG